MEFSAQQRLLLLRLALAGDWTAQKELKPTLTKAQRLPLLEGRLVEEERRKRGAVFLRLTDQGWVWVEAHLAEPLAIPRNTAAGLLDILLRHLGDLLKRKEISFAELSRPIMTSAPVAEPPAEPSRLPQAESPSQATASGDDADQMIEAACLELGGGQPRTRVRLSDLRSRLASIARVELDRRLLSLVQRGRLQLFRLDNPMELYPADREAELLTASGEPRHIVYLTNS